MKTWAADDDLHAKATGVTDGSVSFGAPTRIEAEAKRAYVIVPTLYRYKEKGRPVAEEGQMTFVLQSEATGWKIGVDVVRRKAAPGEVKVPTSRVSRVFRGPRPRR